MAAGNFEGKEHVSFYVKYRPNPPEVITNKIIEYLGEKITSPYRHVLDVGCGSGQSSLIWKPYFQRITGCDISAAQIEEANKSNTFDNVNFIVCPSEDIPLADNSVDLLSVVTALHWFDIENFFKEAKRLLMNNGVLAVQSYHRIFKVIFDTDEKTVLANDFMKKLFFDNLRDYWSPKLELLDNEYRLVNFPFGDIVKHSGIKNRSKVAVDTLIGFLNSYSPYRAFTNDYPEKAECLMKELKEKLCELNGGESKPLIVEQDHFLILCRNYKDNS
ncbi:putative methyltransferase DDB_G0268948 [Centruroides vittatus]|uniref:putative methyltransferase DDB_G0268948 n=1 Tax=Centruroides vittatus TaxID=120091 RepID=UPI00350EC790